MALLEMEDGYLQIPRKNEQKRGSEEGSKEREIHWGEGFCK